CRYTAQRSVCPERQCLSCPRNLAGLTYRSRFRTWILICSLEEYGIKSLNRKLRPICALQGYSSSSEGKTIIEDVNLGYAVYVRSPSWNCTGCWYSAGRRIARNVGRLKIKVDKALGLSAPNKGDHQQ